MATYPATGRTSYKRHDGGSGSGVKVLALFLGIAVGVLVIAAAVLIKIADDARDDVDATATAAPVAHDHSAQGSGAVSLPLQSYAGVTGENAEALAKAHPGFNLNTNHVYTFEALLVAADAFKRARSTDPKALADAIRQTNITDNVSPGPGIQFNEKGQNDKLKDSAIQNRAGKLVTVAPKVAANAKVE